MRAYLHTLLFGHDIFVSYSRRDGKAYATGLAEALTKRGFATAIDRWESEVDPDLPQVLRRKIRSSRMLVVIASKGAAASPFVAAEIQEFIRTRRHFIVVDFAGAVDQACWLPLIPGRERDAEQEQNPDGLELGIPSENILALITNSFGYTRRNRRLQRMFWATVFATLAIAAIGAIVVTQARKLANEAEEQRLAASEKAAEAEVAAKNAAARADQQKRLTDARASAEGLRALALQNGYNTPREVARSLGIAKILWDSGLRSEANNLVSETVSRPATRAASLSQPSPITATLALPMRDALVTAGDDGKIRIWDIDKQILQRTINVNMKPVLLSSDAAGTRLAVASRNSVQVVNLTKDTVPLTYPADEWIRYMTLSKSGRLLAIAFDESLVLKHLDGGPDISSNAWVPGVHDMAFTPDEKFLIVEGFEDESWWFVVVDVSSGKQVRVAQPQLNAFGGRRATLSRDGGFLSTSCHSSEGRPGGCVVQVFQSSDFKRTTEIPHTFNTTERFSFDNRYLLTVEAGIPRVFDLPTGRQLSAAPAVRGATSTAFSGDGRHFAVAASGLVQLIESVSGELAAVAPLAKGMELALISNDGTLSVALDRKAGRIDIWRMRGPHALTGLTPLSYPEGGRITHVIPSPTAPLVAVGDVFSGTDLAPHSTVSLWDLQTNRVAWRLEQEDTHRLAFSRDGKWLAILNFDGLQLRAIDGTTKEIPLNDLFEDVAFGAGGWLLLSKEASVIRVTNLEAGRVIATLKHPGTIDQKFSTDGSLVASLNTKGEVRILELKNQSVSTLQLGMKGFGLSIAWVQKLADGDVLVAVSSGDATQVWNVSRSVLLVTGVPDGAIALNADENVIAASDGVRVRITETATGMLLGDLRAPGITSLAFSANGLLLAGGRRMQAWVWRTADLLAAACRWQAPHSTRTFAVPDWDDVQLESVAAEVCRKGSF